MMIDPAKAFILVYDIPDGEGNVTETYYGDFATAEEAREGWQTVLSLASHADNCRLCQVVEILSYPAEEEA